MLTAIVLLIQSCSEPETVPLFQTLGFEATPVAPGALSISAPASGFLAAFGTAVEHDDSDGAWFITGDGRSRSLPKQQLPAILRHCVAAIEFEEPIAFGPPDY